MALLVEQFTVAYFTNLQNNYHIFVSMKFVNHQQTVQGEGLTNADTICCYCIGKCMTKEALQNHGMPTKIGLD